VITHGDPPGIVVKECQHASEQPGRSPDFNYRGDWGAMTTLLRQDRTTTKTDVYTVHWNHDDVWLVWRNK